MPEQESPVPWSNNSLEINRRDDSFEQFDPADSSHDWDKRREFSFSSIRWRILVIALIAAVTFTGYLGFNLFQANSQAVLLEDIRDKHYPLQAKLQESLFSLRFIQAKLQDAVLTGELESLQEVQTLKELFKKSMSEVELIDPDKAVIVETINFAFDQYYRSSHSLAKDLINGDDDFVKSVLRGEKNALLYSNANKLLVEFKTQELNQFTQSINLVTEQANSIIQLGLPVGLIMFLMVGFALLISRWIIRRIDQIVKTLRNIAHDDGDMSVRIPVDGKDEMAELSFWFNRFIAKLEWITQESTREIKRLAFTDSLTGLPNRRLFSGHLSSEVSRCGRRGTSLAVMFLDLDNFKLVNDQLGHEAGDTLVCEVARRLEETVRGYDLIAQDFESGIEAGEDLVARMGGDEFMLVISDLKDLGIAARIADRVQAALLEPIQLLGTDIEIGVSIGIAVFPDNGQNAEELTAKADQAMYEAKNRGKNNFCFFSAELEEASRLQAETEKALRRAIDQSELELHYQPKYDLSSGYIVGAEALLRWHDPVLGNVSPSYFVPLAESTDLIHELDIWVLGNVCAQIKHWQDTGIPAIPIAVNVSAKQAARTDLVDIVRDMLEGSNLPPFSLEIEVTETSALADMETVAENIRRLKELSVTVALDDFGAGHSSLSLLKYCKIDTLKIDRGFISELGETGKQDTIIGGVIALAQVLNLSVVAEGVEETEQLESLQAMGCHYAQGFLFAHPMPASDFGEFIRQQSLPGKIINAS